MKPSASLPASPDFTRAQAAHQAGKVSEARELYRKVVADSPNHHEALNLLAALHLHAGEAGEALPLLEKAVALRADFPEAQSNRSVALHMLGRFAEAEAAARQALAAQPDYPEALQNLGNALQDLDRNDEAVAAYERSLALRPASPEVHNGLAISLQKLRRHDEAIAALQKAISLRPGYAEGHGNLATVLDMLGRTVEARASYEKALGLKPSLVNARVSLGMLHLSEGRFTEGWPGYEHRWQKTDARILPGQEIPLWLGEPGLPISGKRLLVQFEQGLGDAIQMLRYVPVLESWGAECVVELPETLVPLAVRSLPRSRVVPFTEGGVPKGIDYRVPVMSLPLALKTFSEAAIPRGVPYLQPDPGAVERWRATIPADSRPKFGLVWRGSATHADDRNRSARLDDFLPLLANRNAIWFILQKGLTETETEKLKEFGTAVVFDPALRTLDDTVALLQFVDVVISIDSAPAHLAGALGKRTAILLPFHADWRWMRQREDTPWYPTARLYRQTAPGDWTEVVNRLHAEIRASTG